MAKSWKGRRSQASILFRSGRGTNFQHCRRQFKYEHKTNRWTSTWRVSINSVAHITQGTVSCTACLSISASRFCEDLLQQNALNVLLTDEAVFIRNGIQNVHNTHIWNIEKINIGSFSTPLFFKCLGGDCRLSLNKSIYIAKSNERFLISSVSSTLSAWTSLVVRLRLWFLHDSDLHCRQYVPD